MLLGDVLRKTQRTWSSVTKAADCETDGPNPSCICGTDACEHAACETGGPDPPCTFDKFGGTDPLYINCGSDPVDGANPLYSGTNPELALDAAALIRVRLRLSSTSLEVPGPHPGCPVDGIAPGSHPGRW